MMHDGRLTGSRPRQAASGLDARAPERRGVLVGISIALALHFSVLGCASTTTIRASDPAARIYVDGEYRGDGNVSHTDTKIVGARTAVKLQREGCKPADYSFTRNEELDVGALIGGLFVLVPFLWIQKYKSGRTYEYECVPATPSAVVRKASPEPGEDKEKTSWREDSGLFD